ncbi:hypothetical protein FACS1894141_3160 [Spirochaetia bacterium]|nr:hypothetical protein FACS1894141_3160 [Spirochaetia bacterium]
MYAGVSEGIITPDFPAFLAGYPLPQDRYHQDVHDDLGVHCFYFSNHGVELGMISFDMGMISKKRTKQIRDGIARRCGIPGTNVSVSCTHTHSGPVSTTLPFFLWTDDREMYPHWLDFLVERAVEKMAEAKANSFSAELTIGKGHCGKEQGVGGNRRDKEGVTDPDVCVLAIRETAGALRGLLVNYALHPTFLHAESRSISADYPGYIYEYFKQKNPSLVVGFLQGASGNQSSRHFRSGQNFDEAKRVGYALAREAERVLESAGGNTEPIKDPELFAASYEFYPPLFEIPSLDAAVRGEAKARQDLEDAKAAGKPYPLVRTLECTLIGAEHLLEIAEAGPVAVKLIKENCPFEVQIMGIGENRLVYYSCEVFVEYSLRLKKESPSKNTFFITCTNGEANGYICTPEAHAEGGYEALWTRYKPETGDLMVDFTLEKLKKNEGLGRA